MMNSPSSTKSEIQKLLSSTRDKTTVVANGSPSQSSSTPPPEIPKGRLPPSQDPSVIAFIKSTINEKYIYKQFKQLSRRQHERELSRNDDRWTIQTGRYRTDVNRYTDVIPYDSTRVILRSSCQNSNVQNDDYINASYVYTPKRSRRYIATQGPLENTVHQFWTMVWDHVSPTPPSETSTIIMLTQLTEGGSEKCAQYWPKRVESEFEIPCPDTTLPQSLVIRLVEREDRTESDCTVSTIELFLRDSDGQNTQQHQIKHLLYNGWQDMSVPSSPDKLLNYFQLFRKYHTSEAPPIVHCTAGIGRTGVFIALDYLFTAVPHMTSEEILKDPVIETVDELRNWRTQMVCRVSQLEFIYTLFREMVLSEEGLGD
jgi:protein-tyrosine phosphatase